MGSAEEYFDVYDAEGRPVGRATRRSCHGNPALIHRTCHVVVRDSQGLILLQKRSTAKDIQPGKWDTAVGGHLDAGEDYLSAAVREMREELGVTVDPSQLAHLFDTCIRNEIESEDVRVFSTVCDGPFEICPEEIEAVRFWSRAELEDPANRTCFTPVLITELALLRERGLW